MTTKTFTALDVLADRSNTATNAAHRIRDKATTLAEAKAHNHKSYQEGSAIAYTEAHKIMTAELRRLCNRFQNGYLSIDDFGIVL